MSIELLLDVLVYDVSVPDLIAHDGKDEDVSEVWRVFIFALDIVGATITLSIQAEFIPALFVGLEATDFVVNDCLDGRVFLDEPLEESDEVHEPSDCNNRNVSIFFHHVRNVSHDQLGHDFKNTRRCVWLFD